MPKRNSKNIKFAPLNFHFVKAYPFRAPRNVEIIRAGIAILSELKKYGFKLYLDCLFHHSLCHCPCKAGIHGRYRDLSRADGEHFRHRQAWL